MKKYTVKIDGKTVKQNTIRVSAYPFNRTWPGKQRDISQTEEAFTVYEYGDGERSVEIVCSEPVERVTVRPLSKAVQSKIDGNKITLTLKEHGKYVLEVNDVHNSLHLFYRQEKEFEGVKNATYIFESGEHDVGMLKLQSGDSVYIGKDAVLNASILAVDCENVKIFGYGILCGKLEVRTEKHGDIGWDNENLFDPEEIHTCGGIRMFRCKNITLDGITVTDPASYAVSLFASENIDISDVCVVGLWKYNTDGIDFINCRNVTVKDCFIRSFDDSMCFKGFTAFSHKNMENVSVKNCIFWCDWGKNVDIGLASAAKEITNITVEDCDIIHSDRVCISISDGQWADVHDVAYRNIRIEYRDKYYKPIFQESDEQRYVVEYDTDYAPMLSIITDARRNWQGNISYPDKRTKIHDIVFENIEIFSPISKVPEVLIEKTTDESTIENIRFENIKFNGKTIEL